LKKLGPKLLQKVLFILIILETNITIKSKNKDLDF
jgi:hypothetical protein